MYHIEDEEIDLGKMIKTEVPPVPREVSFTGKLGHSAHALPGRILSRFARRLLARADLLNDDVQLTGLRSKVSNR